MQRYNVSHTYLIRGEVFYLLYFSCKRLVGITPTVKTYIHKHTHTHTYRILVNKYFERLRMCWNTIMTEIYLNPFTAGAITHSGIFQLKSDNMSFVPSKVPYFPAHKMHFFPPKNVI